MAKFDVFVGREKELAQIENWINNWNTTHLITIQGEGGVGKTWLLREIIRRYQDNEKYIVIYFDAAEQRIL